MKETETIIVHFKTSNMEDKHAKQDQLLHDYSRQEETSFELSIQKQIMESAQNPSVVLNGLEFLEVLATQAKENRRQDKGHEKEDRGRDYNATPKITDRTWDDLEKRHARQMEQFWAEQKEKHKKLLNDYEELWHAFHDSSTEMPRSIKERCRQQEELFFQEQNAGLKELKAKQVKDIKDWHRLEKLKEMIGQLEERRSLNLHMDMGRDR